VASATLSLISSEEMTRGLAPFHRRASGLIAGRTILLGALLLLGTVLAFMWLDLVWAIPTVGRWAITRVGLIAGLVAIIAACWWKSRRVTRGHVAFWIDTQAKTGGEMLAGWQLEQRPPTKASSLTQGLAHMASVRAGQRLAGIEPESVLPADALKKAAWMLCSGVGIPALLTIIMPGIAWNQWQRFAFPTRDVPPYTGVIIEIEPSHATVVYGDDVTIKAHITTGRVDDIELVTITPDGKEHIVPMLEQRPERFQAILMRLTTPMDVYARSGRARSRMGRLEVQMTPQIVSAKVRIIPPAYTKRPAFEGAIPKDGIVGLAGTEVEFTVASNRPLSKGRLMLALRDGSGQETTLQPTAKGEVDETAIAEDAATVRGSIRLEKPGRFELSVFDIDGLESVDRATGTITIAVDQRPVVRILEPKPLSLATPDIRLPVVIAAEDDFGLTSLQLFRSLNGSSATAMPCEVDGAATQNEEIELPLDRYGLAPGDEIQLFARTEDNDPAGAKGAESPVTIVRIISTLEMQELMLREEGAQSIQAKYQASERFLENLAEAILDLQKAAEAAASNPDSPEAAAELQKKIQAAQQSAADAAENMEKLSKEPMPIDVDQALAKRLAEMAGKASQAAEQLGEMAKSQGGNRPLSEQENEQLKELAEKIAGQRKQLEEQAIQPLEKLQLALPLIVDQQRFAELARQQRDLALRLDSLRANADPKDAKTQRRIAELEAEQQQRRESLANLLDDIAAHADALPDDPDFNKLKTTAKQFAEEVRASQAAPSMSAAQQSLLSSDFPGAANQAKTAADILESFLGKCEGMGQGACKACEMAFNPSAGSPSLGNSIQQMLAMMGMKPGMSQGNGQGMGFGFGAGGGYAMRSPGPQNVGLYGSLPIPQQRNSRGRGDRQTPGFATNSSASAQQAGSAAAEQRAEGQAAGQAASGVPPQYRSQVAEYFRQLAEQLGEEQ
jgi:hypothetical protein